MHILPDSEYGWSCPSLEHLLGVSKSRDRHSCTGRSSRIMSRGHPSQMGGLPAAFEGVRDQVRRRTGPTQSLSLVNLQFVCLARSPYMCVFEPLPRNSPEAGIFSLSCEPAMANRTRHQGQYPRILAGYLFTANDHNAKLGRWQTSIRPLLKNQIQCHCRAFVCNSYSFPF